MVDDKNEMLWQYTVISPLSKSLSLVRNRYDGRLMLLRVTPADTYPVMATLKQIRDKNLMEVYDVRVSGAVCLSLCEYIEGMTLETRVDQQGILSEQETRRIVEELCGGLDALHRRELVHKDIKPSNVILDRYGTVKLIDYDITRFSKAFASRDTHILGTQGYASPEHFGFSQTDARSDIYSVGVLMNYLLTGHLPFEVLYVGELRPIIDKCLMPDANDRFQSAAQLRDVLEGKQRYDAVVSKRERKSRPFRGLPGFRGKRIFPKIVMGFLLTVWIALFVLGIMTVIKETRMWNEIPWEHIYIGFDLLVMMTGLPYLLMGDVFYLSEKLYPSNPQRGKQIAKALGCVSIGIGVLMMFLYGDIF